MCRCLWARRHIPWALSRLLYLPASQDYPPFGWCSCAPFIELLFTSPEAYRRHGDTPYFRAAHITHIQDVKYILPTDTIIAKLPNYNNFGRKTKLRMNPDNIPDLHWELATLANTINVTTSSYSTPKSDTISIHTLLEQRPLITYWNWKNTFWYYMYIYYVYFIYKLNISNIWI